MILDSKKKKIIKRYASLYKKLRRPVHMSDLKEYGVTKDMIVHHFSSIKKLDEIAREQIPSCFFDVPVADLYSKKNIKQLLSSAKKAKRFVITTAVTGCMVDYNFYNSLKNFCVVNDAELLILVSSDPAHNFHTSNSDWGTIDKRLAEELIVISDVALNNNLFISTIKLSAKQIDPITGLYRIGQKNGSFIYASPKQRMKTAPVGQDKLPRILMTTGAITVPEYTSELYMSQRTAYIADNDHVMGALVIEIEDDRIFHFKQIQADKNGSFCFLDTLYSGDKTSKIRPEAFILGDWHSGQTDPGALKSWLEVIRELKPKKIVVHDLFNGLSINHHEDNKIILKAQRAERNELSLEEELRRVAIDLKLLASEVDEVVVVKSNHDMFLEKYLQFGKYVNDPQNHRISLVLAYAMLDGDDPLREGVTMMSSPDDDFLDRISWLRIDEDFKIAGVHCGAHGDIGPNGAKGTLIKMEETYGNCVVGHSHTPQILRNAWQVGTSSLLRMGYNEGSSSWMHTSCLIYPNGQRTLINSINGKWRHK